jgi:hypothetical protein
VFHGAWSCLDISSVVWDNVEERCLQQQQPVMTWLAVNHGGLFSTAEPSQCGIVLEDSASDIFGLLAPWRWLRARGKTT